MKLISKKKLITIEDKPLDDPERIKDLILLQANRWLAIHYPNHKTALLNVEIYSNETSLGKYQPSNQTIHINSVLVNAYLKTNNFNYILETLKHELIHFVLYEKYNTNGNTIDWSFVDGQEPFENELKKHALLSNYEDEYGRGYRLAICKHRFTNKYDLELITNRLRTATVQILKEMKFKTNETVYNPR